MVYKWYGNVLSIYMNVFKCTYYIWKYLNVFTNIAFGIWPSQFHYYIYGMYAHPHTCFSLSTMTTFSMHYAMALLSSILTFMKLYITTLILIIYTLSYIPHSMSSFLEWSSSILHNIKNLHHGMFKYNKKVQVSIM
jgi:hypothetical protein